MPPEHAHVPTTTVRKGITENEARGRRRDGHGEGRGGRAPVHVFADGSRRSGRTYIRNTVSKPERRISHYVAFSVKI
jgi:hypothetical protein